MLFLSILLGVLLTPILISIVYLIFVGLPNIINYLVKRIKKK
jgi:hypothetical protein